MVNQIVKEIEKLSGRYSGYEIFSDWIKVTACDIDWKCVYMSYVQFSLLGIKATVAQGNTLSGRKRAPEQIYYTPAKKGMLN